MGSHVFFLPFWSLCFLLIVGVGRSRFWDRLFLDLASALHLPSLPLPSFPRFYSKTASVHVRVHVPEGSGYMDLRATV